MQLASGTEAHTVLQGHFKTSNSSAMVMTTILGSCVSICMYDEDVGAGGMNHFLLPGDPSKTSSGNKYGVHAMEIMINELLKLGAQKTALKAKVFGGAQMAANLMNIGEQNGAFARGFLHDESIPIISESLGGTQARRIRFWPGTGAAQQMIVPATEIKVPETRPVPPPKPIENDISLF